MKKSRIALIALVCIGIFLLVYFPHFNYKYPLHVDEWYHISETLKLKNDNYVVTGGTFRIGFDLFLLPLSYIFDLVKIYQYFPAIWAVLTALVLFWVVNKKSGNFYLALLSMIFFASLKSNVNLQGLWFFIPSVFVFPFIFFYVYLFAEGVERQNKKYILWSLGLMLIVLLVHSVSLFFALPFLFVYSLFNYKYILKEWKFFSSFLLIPLAGIIFYSLVRDIGIFESLSKIFYELQFPYGRMPLELNNSFYEVYSPVGYLLACLGIFFLIYLKKSKYLVYLLWPLLTLFSILLFKMFGVSFFAPYQRTMYYFAISLPILSAFGVYYLLKVKDKYIRKENWKKWVGFIIIAVILILTFYSYNNIPAGVQVYHLIEDNDYDSLLFLKNYSIGRVMAPLDISMASYAIAGEPSVGALYFYGIKKKTKEFFSSNSSNNCTQQNKILRQFNVSYVLAEKPIDCNWTLIYNKTNLIYNVKNISNPVKKPVQKSF